jgi:hypothetical protein
MPTGLGEVKTEGEGEGGGNKKGEERDEVLIVGEKRRWFQFLGGWFSPTSA